MAELIFYDAETGKRYTVETLDQAPRRFLELLAKQQEPHAMGHLRALAASEEEEGQPEADK